MICPECNGKGEPCPHCDGSGVVCDVCREPIADDKDFCKWCSPENKWGDEGDVYADY